MVRRVAQQQPGHVLFLQQQDDDPCPLAEIRHVQDFMLKSGSGFYADGQAHDLAVTLSSPDVCTVQHHTTLPFLLFVEPVQEVLL